MSVDRRTFLGRLGAGVALIATGITLSDVGAGATVSGGDTGGDPDPYGERVVNGSFEDGPLGAPISGWTELN